MGGRERGKEGGVSGRVEVRDKAGGGEGKGAEETATMGGGGGGKGASEGRVEEGGRQRAPGLGDGSGDRGEGVTGERGIGGGEGRG